MQLALVIVHVSATAHAACSDAQRSRAAAAPRSVPPLMSCMRVVQHQRSYRSLKPTWPPARRHSTPKRLGCMRSKVANHSNVGSSRGQLADMPEDARRFSDGRRRWHLRRPSLSSMMCCSAPLAPSKPALAAVGAAGSTNKSSRVRWRRRRGCRRSRSIVSCVRVGRSNFAHAKRLRVGLFIT